MLPGIGVPEMIVIGIIALLLFGKRLPEVARSLGKGITEFKKGLRDVDADSDRASYLSSTRESSTARPTAPEERLESTAPKFEPPTSEPTES
ncbi:MAG: twin-arginine translocase TatA/TatE family subunit [Planctomycetaceae bacterium]